MPAKSREQLKKYFRNGALVREEYFADLIDSTFNKVNDKVATTIGGLESTSSGGLEPTSNGGLGLTPSTTGKRYISFFKDETNEKNNTPSFAVHAIGNQQEVLSIGIPGTTKEELKSVVAFKTVASSSGVTNARIGINTVNPIYDLDVNGSIGMRGRIGRYLDSRIDYKQVKADGNWHKILTNLSGFNSFEIITAVAEPEGKYAMHFTVLTIAKEVNRRINAISQQYKWWWQRLQMRCVVEKKGYYGIEVRTAVKYHGAPVIYARITRLWN
jgi:hypothetical protein